MYAGKGHRRTRYARVFRLPWLSTAPLLNAMHLTDEKIRVIKTNRQRFCRRTSITRFGTHLRLMMFRVQTC